MLYAGIGSRETPKDVLVIMGKIARYLESLGYTLHSGAADGADKAFAVVQRKIEFIPWKGFNNCWTGVVPEMTPELNALAASVHPAWSKCSQGAQKMHARNCHQILGVDLKTPVSFVVCWTPDGAETGTTRETGGTGQAIRLAIMFKVPVVNLAREGWQQRLRSIVNGEMK